MFSGIQDGTLSMETYTKIGSDAMKCYVDRPPPSCVIPAARHSIGSNPFKSRMRFVADYVMQYMHKRPGVAVITSGIGSRKYSEVGGRGAASNAWSAANDVSSA